MEGRYAGCTHPRQNGKAEVTIAICTPFSFEAPLIHGVVWAE